MKFKFKVDPCRIRDTRLNSKLLYTENSPVNGVHLKRGGHTFSPTVIN